MVLNDLGMKLAADLRKLLEAKSIDEKFFRDFMGNIVKNLQSADVSLKIALEFAKKVGQSVNLRSLPPGASAKHVIEKAVFEQLVALVNPGTVSFKPVKRQCNVIMMVGLQGSGKTTTCTKLANYYKRRQWKTGVVAADTFRAGAREQLIQNCQQAKIPYYVDFTEMSPVENAKKGVAKFKSEKFEIVIIDTSGRHAQSDALFEEMTMIEDAVNPDEIVLVIDGTIGQAALDQAKAFKDAVSVGSIICTKLDSNAKGGGAISAIAATGAPISFFGTGESFTDLEFFDPKSFVQRLLGIQDPQTLNRKLEELDPEVTKTLSEHILSRVYTFDDMYIQYNELLKMGDFGSIVSSSIPGRQMNRQQSDAGRENARRILTVIGSMTKKEMVDPSVFQTKSRVLRLIEGSGMPPQLVHNVLEEQRKWENAFKRMDLQSLKLMASETMPTFNNDRQFRDSVTKLARYLDKDILDGMGGVQGLAGTLKASWQAKENEKKTRRKIIN